MENALSLLIRSSAVLIFVLAMSVSQIVVTDVKECTEALERVMEYDDVVRKTDG